MEQNRDALDPPAPVAPQRTRERLLEVLRERPAGLTIAELGVALGVKSNAVRKHLVALSKLGAVAAERFPAASVGRPATRYRLAGSGETGFADRMLSGLLLQAVAGLDSHEAERIALDYRPARSGPGTLDDTLGALGFAPADVTSSAQRDAGGRTIELRACPYLELVARPHGRLICAFHRGIVRRDIPVGAELQEFRISPSGPRCRIVLTTPGATPAEAVLDEGGSRGSAPRPARR